MIVKPSKIMTIKTTVSMTKALEFVSGAGSSLGQWIGPEVLLNIW